MSIELTHTKLDFELFPYMQPFIEQAHEIISNYSIEDWAKEPQSKKYQYAHLWVCRRLYSLSTLPEDITNVLTRVLLIENHLTAIAEVIGANEELFVKEYSDKISL